MSNEKRYLIISVLFFIAFLCFGTISANNIIKNFTTSDTQLTTGIQKRAIEKHAAQYSTDSGTFEWTDERVRYIVEGK